jgi:phosphatidylserine/phosphatidylglycerophosphate/cardiolipin synthase-like enzyme
MADTMTTPLLTLADTDLHGLAMALRSGRLGAPFTGIAVQRVASPRLADALAHELQTLITQGFTPTQIATLIDILLHDRAQRRRHEAVIDLVTTGPEAGATTNRDTSVVVRELFAHAEHSVLVAGYAVYQGQRVFQALADRMHQRPKLAVRLFLDVRRTAGDTSRATEVVRRFGERFRRYEWPQGCPLPQVFYFPLSLDEAPEKRAALHAKCVVVDRHIVFVSSANFTEAAQERNIEVGLLIQAGWLAERITGHFDTMVTERLLLPIYQ